MTALEAGDRVRLVHTTDAYTRLRPGDEGTVTWAGERAGDERVDVDWDSGSSLSMLLNEGDVVEVIR